MADLSLPADLRRVLRSARAVEDVAGNDDQRRVARLATGRLAAALLAVGWHATELAPDLGRTPETVLPRARVARASGSPAAGLAVAPRPAPPPKLWLSSAEAAQLIGVHQVMLYGWRTAGLLPNSATTVGGGRWRYARADLDAVRAARAGRRILRPGVRANAPAPARVLDRPAWLPVGRPRATRAAGGKRPQLVALP